MPIQIISPENLYQGEIGLKRDKNSEEIYIKNDDDEVLSLPFRLSASSEVIIIKEEIATLTEQVNALIEKTFTFNLSLGATTTIFEIGHSGTTTLTFAVSGDISNTDCTYKLYTKIASGQYIDSGLVFTQQEITTGRKTVNVTTTVDDMSFKIEANYNKDSLNLTRTKEITFTHVYKTLFGAFSGDPTSYDELVNFIAYLENTGGRYSLQKKQSYRMNFGGPYYNSLLIICTPYSGLKSIKDDNQFEYINGYTLTPNIDPRYYVYIKNERVTNTTPSYYLTISF